MLRRNSLHFFTKFGTLSLVILLLASCSIRKMAMNSIAGSFDNAMDVYTSDNDPQLVKDAMPSSLKMIEMLLANSPDNVDLLTAAAGGFTMYSHAFLVQEADYVEEQDLQKARQMRTEGKKLFLRARDYGLRGLDVNHPGLPDNLAADTTHALDKTTEADIPLMYYTAAAWGSAISLNTDDYELILDLPKVKKLINRCLHLDESWGNGQLHEFMISFAAGTATLGGSLQAAERHFHRALEINEGHSAGTYVTAAEAIAVKQQDKAQFKKWLNKALAIDVDNYPNMRLMNVLAQERARWLLDHMDKYFI